MSKKAYTFCVHDDTVNTYGFRMLTAGANLAEFAKNPVVLYNHNDWDAPIGRGENIRKEGDRILVDIVFDTDDPKAADIAGKVERGFLRMCSVGAWAEEASDAPALKLEGQTGSTVTRGPCARCRSAPSEPTTTHWPCTTAGAASVST